MEAELKYLEERNAELEQMKGMFGMMIGTFKEKEETAKKEHEEVLKKIDKVKETLAQKEGERSDRLKKMEEIARLILKAELKDGVKPNPEYLTQVEVDLIEYESSSLYQYIKFIQKVIADPFQKEHDFLLPQLTNTKKRKRELEERLKNLKIEMEGLLGEEKWAKQKEIHQHEDRLEEAINELNDVQHEKRAEKYLNHLKFLKEKKEEAEKRHAELEAQKKRAGEERYSVEELRLEKVEDKDGKMKEAAQEYEKLREEERKLFLLKIRILGTANIDEIVKGVKVEEEKFGKEIFEKIVARKEKHFLECKEAIEKLKKKMG